jgi:hypothetical protein
MSRPKPYVMSPEEQAQHDKAQLEYAAAEGAADLFFKRPFNPKRFHNPALQAAYEADYKGAE